MKIKYIKHITFLFLSICGVASVYGQSWSQFGLTSLNPYREFSAYGGMDRKTTLTAHVRSQWSQLVGSPSTQYVAAHSPVYIWNGAVGLDIMNQSQGNINLKRIRTSYNYVTSTSIGLFSLGGRVGMVQGSLDGSKVTTPEGDYGDGSINHNDPVLDSQLSSGLAPTYEVSVFFLSEKWSSGISFADLPFTKLRANRAELGLHSQLNVFFNYFLPIVYNVDLQSTISLRSDFINTQTEINSIAKINGNIFGGLLFRGYSSSSIDAMGVIFGHSLNRSMSLFYSYEFGLSDLRTTHQGSHELVMKYKLDRLFGTGLPPKTIYNPRFL